MNPAGQHHLMICFIPDGPAAFYPETEDSVTLAARFEALVRFSAENPSSIRCAAGDHRGHDHDVD